jgi:excisionase family DNA binding protein
MIQGDTHHSERREGGEERTGVMAQTRETTTPASPRVNTTRLRPTHGVHGGTSEPGLAGSAGTHPVGRSMTGRVAGEATLLTFKEAMEFLRVSRSTVYRLMWSGQLRGHKVGSTWRFYRSELLEAVASPVYDPAAKRPARLSEGQD